MKKILISTILASTLTSSFLVADDSKVSVSANMAMTSNYLWRGMTQTDNAPAIQGGVDVEYNGFYLGTWGSNISWTNDNDSSIEVDIYAGYANKFATIDYDIGYIRYAYPKVQDDNNFDEVYLSLGKDFSLGNINLKYSKAVDVPSGADKLYDIEGIYSTTLSQDIGLSLMYGKYEDTGKRAGITLSKTYGKFDISLSYVDFQHDSDSSLDEDNVVVTVSTSF